nr:penicillin acylase family protein [Arsenophonus endosymbiont of Aleurodicus floccissimus]
MPSPYNCWADFLVNQLDTVLTSLTSGGKKLTEATWGQNNKADIVHPFVHVLSFLHPWFAAPSNPLSGDHNMPHVNRPGFGASSQLVVAPAKEHQGTLTMPGGQSGNPISPWFLAGHDHWVKGGATSSTTRKNGQHTRFGTWEELIFEESILNILLQKILRV